MFYQGDDYKCVLYNQTSCAQSTEQVINLSSPQFPQNYNIELLRWLSGQRSCEPDKLSSTLRTQWTERTDSQLYSDLYKHIVVFVHARTLTHTIVIITIILN